MKEGKHLMNYLLAVSVLAASFNSILLSKSGANKRDTVFGFNFLCALIWCVVLFVGNNCRLHINAQIVFWGIMYGTAQTFFLLFKTAAMSAGSVSITTLIGNSSLLVSLFVSLVLWKESVTTVDIIGLIFLCLSIFLCTYRKSENQHTASWKYYTILFFLFAASVGIIFKAFGKSGNLAYCGDMMLFSSIIMACSNFIISRLVKGDSSENQKEALERKKFLIFALGSGILSCIYNRLNIFLSGSMDAILFFPGFNGGVILLSTVLSVIVLKEKLLIQQKVGLLIGTISICVIGIF